MKAFENYIKRKKQPHYALVKESEKKETKYLNDSFFFIIGFSDISILCKIQDILKNEKNS